MRGERCVREQARPQAMCPHHRVLLHNPAMPLLKLNTATAEQIRLAQVIYDKNDADFEDKVKQLIEVTGKNQDECMVALHDCNEDVNRAINFLLEDSSDTTSWETVGKKRGLVKEGSSSENKENKENRDKRGEREASRGRGGPNKRGRGANRTRDVRLEENGVDLGPGERGVDRRGRGRGRGSGVRGRGRGAGGSRFTSQGMGTFNPADYTPNSNSGAGSARSESWEPGAKDGVDGTAWKNCMDDWATEDWNEDLSETKVFTSSSAPVAENHIAPGQSLDLVSLLHKPGGTVMDMGEQGEADPPSAESLGHSLVFTNSQHHNARTSAPSYAHAALSSVLGSGFGSLGGCKPAPQVSGSPILDQLKGTGLVPRPAQQPVAGSNSNAAAVPTVAAAGVSSVTAAPVPTTTWDIKAPAAQPTALSSQFSREFKAQPEPSLVLSQLAQRQQSSLPQVQPTSPPTRPTPSPPGLETFPKPPREASPTHDGPTPGAKTTATVAAPGATDPQTSAGSQQRQMKTQKRRVPPTSKIPSSAVEMPGSADVSGLNVQFGALDFGSEPTLPDFSQSETCSTRETAPVAQTPNSLYSKPISEPLGNSLSLPMSSLPSSMAPPCSVTPPAPSSSSSSSSGSCTETAAPSHPHLPFSQGQDSSAAPVTNGFNGVRTAATHDTTSASTTPKPESPALGSSSSSSSARPPSALLPPAVPPHSTALPSLSSELPSASPLPPLSSSLSSSHLNSTQSSVSALSSSSSLTHTSVDSAVSHTPSTAPAPLSSNGMAAAGGTAVSVTSSAHGSGPLGMTANGTTVPSVCRTAPLPSSTSGKAPPNLAQGVPPLLPNQYIMGPGGLLPAYPQIYGYEDLQMLQSRLPMDYYGITFPGPAATLAGRDGSLANTPYSGEVTKFGRADSASPAPPTSLSAAPPQAQQPPQAQSGGQSQAPQQQGQHGGQQAFLNPALPPGYGYTGLPYYPGVPGVPSAFQYGPTMFVPPASAKQHGVGLGNPSTQFQQQQQPAYGQHTYASGFDDLTQGQGAGDYSKGGYSSSSQAQAKAASAGQGKGISVTSSNAGVPDMTTSVYNKTQSFDKQGFHTGTPPPFSLPSALGGTGPLNPGGAPGYAPAPFLHILPPHQQPHSQLLHHHLTQDGQGGPSQRSQTSSMQQKTQVTKSSYGGSPYWGN
ncbi:hypothetical protein JZ751_001101 [Albula glossodonta]|uniref:UBA domain-containing protein n=1 Tax=Albula glossodonta TaxID=121402 RepID=A0A8T2PSR0_9TELE|nr:hypothetical protein JZ751_001101 [Albula glossodonta]